MERHEAKVEANTVSPPPGQPGKAPEDGQKGFFSRLFTGKTTQPSSSEKKQNSLSEPIESESQQPTSPKPTTKRPMSPRRKKHVVPADKEKKAKLPTSPKVKKPSTKRPTASSGKIPLDQEENKAQQPTSPKIKKSLTKRPSSSSRKVSSNQEEVNSQQQPTLSKVNKPSTKRPMSPSRKKHTVPANKAKIKAAQQPTSKKSIQPMSLENEADQESQSPKAAIPKSPSSAGKVIVMRRRPVSAGGTKHSSSAQTNAKRPVSTGGVRRVVSAGKIKVKRPVSAGQKSNKGVDKQAQSKLGERNQRVEEDEVERDSSITDEILDGASGPIENHAFNLVQDALGNLLEGTCVSYACMLVLSMIDSIWIMSYSFYLATMQSVFFSVPESQTVLEEDEEQLAIPVKDDSGPEIIAHDLTQDILQKAIGKPHSL